jgi:drug/metabolite transporter (DMT)-like permease
MMHKNQVAAFLPTSVFVLLWSSGAIFSEVGLQHGSPFALLLLRYGLALTALTLAACYHRQLLPAKGTRGRVMLIGALIAGLYSISYLLAMQNGVTPGILHCILGVQPILTIMITERRASSLRIAGLLLAFLGLSLVVNDGLEAARFEALGVVFAILALIGITIGSIIQKRETQAPWVVLPLQYSVAVGMILLLTPFVDVTTDWSLPFISAGLWLGLVISVAATFLLYHLIARGNLVNVTSLFYLVPAVTAAMDWIFLGNPMSAYSLAGLALVMAGLLLVFRKA